MIDFNEIFLKIAEKEMKTLTLQNNLNFLQITNWND